MLPQFMCTMCNASRRTSTELLRFVACLAITNCRSLITRGQKASLRAQVFQKTALSSRMRVSL